ncbi:hypothetical protein ncot_15595 [Nocardioides sp. JQ2195]|uniref:hypothetical protein n=1 Tax=Nocardioides sp. JQ2195 TaxID=2592334 RepID=UPI00143E73A9|nr:hypothetical protein [Nocardioides sp. JQ2195]QIX27854.1 hypothetical protein ncot_15595 [Nocardioides sp. JQ2195]
MYLRDLLTSCLRRWPLLLVCLAVTAGATYAVFMAISPSYESQASVVLVPPQSKEQPDQNRYLGLGGLKQSADVLARTMMSEETTAAIRDAAPEATYQVEPDWATSAPILDVKVTSDTAQSAEAMLETILRRIPVNLRNLQESVDIAASNQITQVLVSRDTAPDPVEKLRIRLAGLTLAGLLLMSALLIAAVDGLMLRRSSRDKVTAASRTRSPKGEGGNATKSRPAGHGSDPKEDQSSGTSDLEPVSRT